MAATMEAATSAPGTVCPQQVLDNFFGLLGETKFLDHCARLLFRRGMTAKKL
jgi:hypothetical protein